MSIRHLRRTLAAVLALLLIGGVAVLFNPGEASRRIHVVAYFDNSNGIYPGDEVRILGVPVGKIETIEPQPRQAKVSFWYDAAYDVPADAKAVILSPSLVAVRAIQLTPAYTGGETMADGATISRDDTAVPVEWDDFREQLGKLTDMLQPIEPGGVSTLGAFVNTAAGNLRGQGPTIRETIIKLSSAFSALGDHSTDLFSSIRNLALLVSALQDSTDVMAALNENFAEITNLLADDPNEVGAAVTDIDGAVGDVQSFIVENKDTLATTVDGLASVSTTLYESLDDLKQSLHSAPTLFQNFINIYQPSQNALTGALAVNNFADPISFICGAIQAASRLGAEQSAKLCVQYLAPIVKNRQLNFPPLGENAIVGQTARPNEITYSEDWMRPDYIPPPADVAEPAPLAAEASEVSDPNVGLSQIGGAPTDPDRGLQGMMVPSGAGS